jgi:ubiquinone/menaquinone biosynthesis C-methylase UbiE
LLNRTGAAMNRLALAELPPEPGDRLLEVGFGGGGLLRSLLEREAALVTGVDVSEAMLARARRRFSGEERLRLLLGSAEKLPLDSGSVDKAYSVNSIYFWKDLAAVSREFERVIRPGGSLALCFQTPQAVRSWPGHVHGFSAHGAGEVTEHLEQAGFRTPRAVRGSDRRVGEFVCLVSERL